MWIILTYLVAIVMANVITAATHPLVFWMFIIPWGSFLIGITFILRDIIQMSYGRAKTYGVIAVALVLSAVLSRWLGDTMSIVIASALTFAVSETADTEVYTRLKLPPHLRVWWSGVVGGFLDSTIFVIIGLSPWGAGFLPWTAVPAAILGQVIIKTAMQGIGFFGVKYLYRCKHCQYYSGSGCTFLSPAYLMSANSTCRDFKIKIK